MENMRNKIAEIITHTHKTPLEQADEILLLLGEQLKAFADYAQQRMWEDGGKDLSEFVDEFESL